MELVSVGSGCACNDDGSWRLLALVPGFHTFAESHVHLGVVAEVIHFVVLSFFKVLGHVMAVLKYCPLFQVSFDCPP